MILADVEKMKFKKTNNKNNKNEIDFVELSKIANDLKVGFISGIFSYDKQIGVDEIIASESRSRMFNYE